MKGLGNAFIGLSKYLGMTARSTLPGAGLTLRSDDAGAAEGPSLDMWRKSATPADDDIAGATNYKAQNDAGTTVTYARQRLILKDVSSGTEDAELRTDMMISGVLTNDTIWPCPRFAANKNNVDQNIVSGSDDQVTFTTEVLDVGGYYSAGASAWTPPAGDYLITAQIEFTGANAVIGEDLIVIIKKNGGSISRLATQRVTGGSQAITTTILTPADGDDVFQCFARKAGAGNGVIRGDTFSSFFVGQRVQ